MHGSFRLVLFDAIFRRSFGVQRIITAGAHLFAVPAIGCAAHSNGGKRMTLTAVTVFQPFGDVSGGVRMLGERARFGGFLAILCGGAVVL